jgi:hypothetical protein
MTNPSSIPLPEEPVTEKGKKLLTLRESNDPANYVTTAEPCAGCGSTKWAWRAGTFNLFPNTCSECPVPAPKAEQGIRELLDAFAIWCFNNGKAYAEARNANWNDYVNGARSAIESLWEAREKEIARLREELDAIAEQHRMAIDTLALLRSSALNKAELEYVLACISEVDEDIMCILRVNAEAKLCLRSPEAPQKNES